MHVDKPQYNWENTLWTNETKSELLGKSQQFYVYRKRSDAFKVKKAYIVKTRGGVIIL